MTRWEVLPPNVKVQSIIGNVKQVSVAGKRESKYHNKIAYYDGIAFDSIKERDYYADVLLPLKWAGEIKSIDMQVSFVLQPPFKHGGKTIKGIKYVADFVITYPDGRKKVIDTKGYRTKEYQLKRKILLYKYPEIDFEEA